MPDETTREILSDIRGDLKVGREVMETAKQDIAGLRKERTDDLVKHEGRFVTIEKDVKDVKEKCKGIISGDTTAAKKAAFKLTTVYGGGGLGVYWIYQLLLDLADKVPLLKLLLPGAD